MNAVSSDTCGAALPLGALVTHVALKAAQVMVWLGPSLLPIVLVHHHVHNKKTDGL